MADTAQRAPQRGDAIDASKVRVCSSTAFTVPPPLVQASLASGVESGRLRRRSDCRSFLGTHLRRSARLRAQPKTNQGYTPTCTTTSAPPSSDRSASDAAYDGSSLEGFAALAARPAADFRPAPKETKTVLIDPTSAPPRTEPLPERTRLVPLWKTVFGDQLTPVTAYRCLVHENDTTVPSFLLESVHTGERVGRYSYVGANPVVQVTATANRVVVVEDAFRQEWLKDEDHKNVKSVVDGVDQSTGRTRRTTTLDVDDPWKLIRWMTEGIPAAAPQSLPGGSTSFCGGWVGYGGYDTMRYAEASSLPFSGAPEDDRGLPDLHMGLYQDTIVFDHVAKVVYVVHWVDLAEFPKAMELSSGSEESWDAITAAHTAGLKHLEALTQVISRGIPLSPIASGRVDLNVNAGSQSEVVNSSNMTREEFGRALDKIHEHIVDGDAFQVVFSQRFERRSAVDPFSTYRALRVINPSPYMIYMQCEGSILVASSPEILCRVVDGVITNRPLAGTRPRGRTPEEDKELEKELMQDPKDCAEHVMLVDLGRNDVGRVAEFGSVKPEEVMVVERYSNVMHISSTVTGELRQGLTSWDALRAALPVGTISGAPKVRAMQIIDDLEPTRRGPYGGGIGFISFQDTMNIALALRTMVVRKTGPKTDDLKAWRYDLQAGAGIVYDSDTELEYMETINKAMALNRAIDLAETAFDSSG